MINHQPKYAIYTAMVGGYDEILQPKVVDDHFDYILFSNDIKEERVGVWQVRLIPYHDSDNTRICRYVKTHPEELLSEYEFSIWMDANIRIINSFVYERSLELYNEGIFISSFSHPLRNCIYDEAFELMYRRYEKEQVVVKWCQNLRKKGYPKNNGLFETNLMYRNHKLSIVSEIDALWWSCIREYSRRDQLSFNFVLWKYGIVCEFFLPEQFCARNVEHFELALHTDMQKKIYPCTKNDSWLLKYCWKKSYKKEIIKKRYDWIYNRFFPFLWIKLLGQYYRLKEIYRRMR